MPELDGLRKRVEQIDLRLKTAHRAREKESAALMDMWEQIRVRLVDQNAQIGQLRAQVAELEDTRDDLLTMVHGLLSAVEGGLERMSDETVPQIRAMARNLLSEEDDRPLIPARAEKPVATRIEHPAPEVPEPDEISEPDDEAARSPNFHDDLLQAIERSIENIRGEEAHPDETAATGTVSKAYAGPVDEPASPGIRNLVARIENAVGPEFLDTIADDDDQDLQDDELSRDLQEIEALRGELNGLRERIASGR